MKTKELERLYYLERKFYNQETLSEKENREFEKLFNSRIQELIREIK